MKALVLLFLLALSSVASARDMVVAVCGSDDRALTVARVGFGPNAGSLVSWALIDGETYRSDCRVGKTSTQAFACEGQTSSGEPVSFWIERTEVGGATLWSALGQVGNHSLGIIQPCRFY